MDENYRSPLPERLRWRNWASNPEGITGDELMDFINNDLFKTVKELDVDRDKTGRAAVVRAVFEDAYNYMKSGPLLRQVVNKINEVHSNHSLDHHLFRQIYVQILVH